MSASIFFPLQFDAPDARVTGPWGPSSHVHLEFQTAPDFAAPTLSVSCSNDQLAAIAKAILAHLEQQEAGDFVEAVS